MDSPKIKNITQLNGTHRLYVVWDNGVESIVNFKPIIKRFKLLKPRYGRRNGGTTQNRPERAVYLRF